MKCISYRASGSCRAASEENDSRYRAASWPSIDTTGEIDWTPRVMILITVKIRTTVSNGYSASRQTMDISGELAANQVIRSYPLAN
jgi:hypothetical protein